MSKALETSYSSFKMTSILLRLLDLSLPYEAYFIMFIYLIITKRQPKYQNPSLDISKSKQEGNSQISKFVAEIKCNNFQTMFIEDPTFIHRKIMNARNEVPSDDPSYKFGIQRNQLIKYVTSALSKHERDEQILEKFRKQAEQLKRRKFQSKKKSNYEIVLNKKSTNQNLPPIAIPNASLVNHEQKELMSPKNTVQNTSSRPQRELESVLQYQSDLVQKYRKLLNIKEKELKSKDKKLERNRHALDKMSQRIKYLEKERFLVEREEEIEMNHMHNILKQLTNQIAQNKSNLSYQLSSIRKEAKSSWEANLSTEVKHAETNVVENHEEVPKKPSKNQLQLIKRKAKSLKHDSEPRVLRSPTVLYTKIPTEQSNELDSPRNGNYLSELNRSIIKQSKFMGLVSEDSRAAK